MPLKPADRCGCSLCAGPEGCCQICCGPPISFAVRGVCTILLLDYLIVAIASGVQLKANDCCKTSADSVIIIGIILGIVGCMIYLFGLVRLNSDTTSASILFHLHMVFTIFYELFDICYTPGLSKSKRDKDPTFDLYCSMTCAANNTNACRAFRNETCNYRSSSPAAVIGVIIQLFIKLYWGYILWSYWVRMKTGTLDGGLEGNGYGMQAAAAVPATSAPMAIPADSIPMAIPVARAEATPIAQPVTQDTEN